MSATSGDLLQELVDVAKVLRRTEQFAQVLEATIGLDAAFGFECCPVSRHIEDVVEYLGRAFFQLIFGLAE